ncbi:MAG: hypothetical protein ACREJB_18260, partial [Planctomycetaceae bacterium]
ATDPKRRRVAELTLEIEVLDVKRHLALSEAELRTARVAVESGFKTAEDILPIELAIQKAKKKLERAELRLELFRGDDDASEPDAEQQD